MPGFISSALALPSQAAIPLMLLVLGMHFAGTTGIEARGLVSVAVVTRLIIGTLVGWGLTVALGAEGTARDVMIIGGSMPTAVSQSHANAVTTSSAFRERVVRGQHARRIVNVTAVLALLSR